MRQLKNDLDLYGVSDSAISDTLVAVCIFIVLKYC